jgi:hypothetical protein
MKICERGWAILDATDRFLYEFHRWEDARDNFLDAPTSDALDNLLGVIEGETPEGFGVYLEALRKLQAAVHQIDLEAGAFEVSGDEGQRFLNAVDAVESIRHRKDTTPQKRLESIRELSRQNVSMEQIARMYGLMDQQGRLRIDLVEREMNQGGSVLTDQGLVRRDIEDFEYPFEYPDARWTPHSRLNAEMEAMQAETPKGPESSYDLYLLSRADPPLSAQQAAAMLGKPLAEVSKEWEQFDEDRRLRERLADYEAAERARKEIESRRKAYQPAPTDDDGYEQLDRAALVELCKEREIPVQGNLSKEKLIARLRQQGEPATA